MKRRTAATRKRFLEIYAECGNITMAAREAGVCRDTHYQWLLDPEYAAAFEEAEQIASDLLLEEARRRAHDGWDEPVVYQGELQYEKVWNPEAKRFELTGAPLAIRKYDSTLLMFLIKAKRPEYRETWRGELQHSDAISRRAPDFSVLSDEQFEFLRTISSMVHNG